MSAIIQVPTPEQLTNQAATKIASDNVGLTNFNDGGRIASILEAVGMIVTMFGLDMIEAARRLVPVFLYDGLGFDRKGATRYTGYFRFYRLPKFTLDYTGSGSSATLTITTTALTTTVTGGGGGEDLNVDLTTYTTVQTLVDQINAHVSTSWTAVVVSGAASYPTSDLHNHSGSEIVGTTDYLDAAGIDVMQSGTSSVTISSGAQILIDDTYYQTTAAGSIAAGAATSVDIAASAVEAGASEAGISALSVGAVDTLNGTGVLVTTIPGVEYVINDSAFSGGQDEETDEDRAIRFQTEIQGIFGGTKFAIEAQLLRMDSVRSVDVSITRGVVNCYIDDGTGTLSSDLIDEALLILEGDPDDQDDYPGCVCAGMTVNLYAPTIQGVNVTVDLTRIGTLSDTTEIESAAQTAAEQYINTLRLGEDVIYTELVKVVKSSHTAIYDCTFTTPTSNTSIADGYVARTGAGSGATVTITFTTLDELP